MITFCFIVECRFYVDMHNTMNYRIENISVNEC